MSVIERKFFPFISIPFLLSGTHSVYHEIYTVNTRVYFIYSMGFAPLSGSDGPFHISPSPEGKGEIW
jgi:hypothetical protein